MEQLKRINIILNLLAGLVMAVVGCAGKHVDKTLQAEEALAAAGFRLKMANTPAKVEFISRIPHRVPSFFKIYFIYYLHSDLFHPTWPSPPKLKLTF